MVLDRRPKIPLRPAERHQDFSSVAASRQIVDLDGCVPFREARDLQLVAFAGLCFSRFFLLCHVLVTLPSTLFRFFALLLKIFECLRKSQQHLGCRLEQCLGLWVRDLSHILGRDRLL